MGVKTFWCEPTGQERRRLQVFCSNEHRNEVVLDDGVEWDDAPWPEFCGECGERFVYSDDGDGVFQSIATDTEFKRCDTGDTAWHLRDFGPGAMWDAGQWMEGLRKADGRYLVAICPDGHEWAIDSEASNCDRKGQDHDCWNRHGEPPVLTVDKHPLPGRTTCNAGAGSIQTPTWHGFLRDGEFVVA